MPQLVIVMPVGPAETVDQLSDSLDAISTYTPAARVILVDDSGTRIGRAVGGIEVIETPGGWGAAGGLYRTLSLGYQRALDYRPDVILKLDVDALLIGPGVETLAAARFAADPRCAILGSFQVDCEGRPRTRGWASKVLLTEMARCDARGRLLTRWFLPALRHGYHPGFNCLGGAYCVNPAYLADIHARGWLNRPELATSRLGEDHLFGLLAYGAGWRLDDFATGALPFGVRLSALPGAPESLIARGKLVVHSVKRYGDLTEPEIRAVFRVARHHDTIPFARKSAINVPSASASSAVVVASAS